MYIVGHYVTTRLSKRFSNALLDGLQGPALYLPDFVRCHEWGYAECFRMPDDDPTGALIKAHMLGDWWVHYGLYEEAKRRGWAYRRMAVFARHYDVFFETARREDLLRDASGPRDSVRGFSHTMMEYAIDTHLAASLAGTTFAALQSAIGGVGEDRGAWSEATVRAQLAARGITGSFDGLAGDLHSFRARALAARAPQEFAYRAGVKKFGLHDHEASLALVRETIAAGLGEIPGTEIDAVVEETGRFIANHVATTH